LPSIKDNSYATSDTEEKKSVYDKASEKPKKVQKRLSKVDEEFKNTINPIRDTFSE